VIDAERPTAAAGAGEVTRLLQAYAAGDAGAFDRLFPLVYDELRRIARRHLRHGARGYTLDTTGLVHEAYLKLGGAGELRLEDRCHLLAVAARAMRQILISKARARSAAKRGGGGALVPIDATSAAVESRAEWLLDLDRALERLGELDERLVRIVECRFFWGATEEETAEALGIPLRTAQRGWTRARAWLRAELEARDAPGR
jgi:RNA polymerase sigma factor (TIGR02999 family)